LHRLVELAVGDLDATTFRLLQQQRIIDQGFEHLALQNFLARQSTPGILEIYFYQFDPILQLAFGNNALVDNCNYLVERSLDRGGRVQQQAASEDYGGGL
jgi:hypothetical protein